MNVGGKQDGLYLTVTPELAADGFIAGRDRIARLRRELGIRCRQKRKFKATTNSKHTLPVAENLLNQDFTPSTPNEIWVTDITYIPTQEGWLYLAGVKDVFTCEIVGYAMAERMTQELTGRALFRAVQQKRPAAGLLHHSDRGSQYCALDYQKLVKQFGMIPSMRRKGNCYDNAQWRVSGAASKTNWYIIAAMQRVQKQRLLSRNTLKSSITAKDDIRVLAIFHQQILC